MQRNIIEESQRFREIPTTLVDVCDMGDHVRVYLETVCGLHRESHRVATFSTMFDAVAFVSSEYGLTRQACDGDSAHAGWWLS
jgi:hypothetical protein